MADPLVLVLAALASVSTVVAALFRLLMSEKDRSLDRLERDAAERAHDLKEDNDWLRDKVATSLENQIRALDLMSTAINQQGAADRATGEVVHEILALLQGTIDPRAGTRR